LGERKLSMLSEQEIRETFEKVKEWFRENIPDFSQFVDEPRLEFLETNDGWDIERSISENVIRVNMYRVRWHLRRENLFKDCPKYDIETALVHDLFEYCYMRRWDYPDNNIAIKKLVHERARLIENSLRLKKGLTEWI